MHRAEQLSRPRPFSTWALFAFLVLTACAQASGSAPGSPATAAEGDVLQLTCDGALTGEDLTVQPQPDGVHVVIQNTTGERMNVGWTYADGSGGGNGLEPGPHDLVFQAGPGRFELDCSKHLGPGTPVQVTVEDPEGLWVDPSLSCRSETVTSIDYIEIPVYDDPDSAGEQILAPSGVERVIQAGYPLADERVYVLRDGERQVASVQLTRSTQGWIEGAIASC